MLKEYELRQVISQLDWEAYHRIRRTEIFESRGRVGVYNETHQDEHEANNQPLLLLFEGRYIGTVRLNYVPPDLGIIRLFAIDGPVQRLGHGRNFLSLLESHAKSFGIATFEANSAPEAVGFWRQQSFEMIDEAREFPLLRRQMSHAL
jgi:N-acetylglutamate synthase-like GNAT family acetyltransferase